MQVRIFNSMEVRFIKRTVSFLFSLQVIVLFAFASCSSPFRNQRKIIVTDATIPDNGVPLKTEVFRDAL